jgi:hypothetical protein
VVLAGERHRHAVPVRVERAGAVAVLKDVGLARVEGVGDDQAVGGVDVCSWRLVSPCAVASSAERRADGRDQRPI